MAVAAAADPLAGRVGWAVSARPTGDAAAGGTLARGALDVGGGGTGGRRIFSSAAT
jgi:hypothetical protein